ncbi:condensation domain-containing protein [Dongia sedimenti]|uniref:Condensation domain-containing protein n=1 Tax=Dongia sedimenti TaxID=3064282 RepID=A0ABU0YHW5_9PROT|nr:condensation domain-containing protein [Rhodospirillaceae bacterium R-7]
MRQLHSAVERATAPAGESLPPQEVRPLGAFENLFAAYCEEASATFTLMAELEGDITKVGIRRALDQVQARHPLLAVGIRRNASGRRVFVRSARAIPLKDLPTGAVPWELAAGLEIRRRFDVEAGPLMLASVRFEAKSVRMFFTFHHGIADGLSAAFIIQDFARALSGERLGSFFDAATLDRRLALLPREAPAVPEEAGPTDARGVLDPQALQRWGRGMSAMPIVASHGFARDFTRRLREVARFHDATVHAALSVALARAMGALRPWGRPICVMSPISLRGMLGVEGECGIFIGGGSAALDPAGDSFWDEARKARAALEPFMNNEAAHAMIAGMTAFRDNDDSPAGARAGFAAGFDFDAMLTNLGALPIEARHGRVRIKAVAGPIVLASVQDEHIVGVATLEDEMRLTYTSVAPLSGLLKRVEKKLFEACAGW